MSMWMCVCENYNSDEVCMCVTGLGSCTPWRPVKRASASSPLLLKLRHHQQSESHLYIISSHNRAGVSSPWVVVTWWGLRITVLMAHDYIGTEGAMKHAIDTLWVARYIRSCRKMHIMVVHFNLKIATVLTSSSKCITIKPTAHQLSW